MSRGRAAPGERHAFHVAGQVDYISHVADGDALRSLILDHITGHPAVSATKTTSSSNTCRRRPTRSVAPGRQVVLMPGVALKRGTSHSRSILVGARLGP